MTDQALFWNRAAEKYARKPVADPDAFERKIAATKSRMRPEHVVLDIGCGTGSLALRLAPAAAHVYGLDISREMIRIARDKARAVDNVTFHEGPFDDGFRALAPGSLDGVCAYSVLHLVDDRPAALARIFGLLKPGGFFVSSTPCLAETWVPFRPLIGIMRALGKAPSVGFFSKKRLREDLRAAGFVDLEEPDVGAGKLIAFVVASRPR